MKQDFWIVAAVALGVSAYIYMQEEPYAPGSGGSGNSGFAINNPGNLRYISANPFVGQVGKSATGFGIYDSLAHGVRAMYKLLSAYYARGLTTVNDVVRTYAPSSENNTQAYIDSVSNDMGIAPDEQLTWPEDAVPLIQAMVVQENGYNDMSDDQVGSYIRAA